MHARGSTRPVSWRNGAARADRYIKENALSWTHGLADLKSGVVERYKIRRFPNLRLNVSDQGPRMIPLTFLIGPDGRILAHDLIGGELEAVRKALADERLFRKATTSTQPPPKKADDQKRPLRRAGRPGPGLVRDDDVVISARLAVFRAVAWHPRSGPRHRAVTLPEGRTGDGHRG
jgi:hypothetical protein